jgi:hypothetical protein
MAAKRDSGDQIEIIIATGDQNGVFGNWGFHIISFFFFCWEGKMGLGQAEQHV